jgi:hypothetical protein
VVLPRLYNEEQLWLQERLAIQWELQEVGVRWLWAWDLVKLSWIEGSAGGSQLVQFGSWSEMGNSQWGREAVDMEVEGSAALETITRQLVNTQQTEKS